MLLRHCAQLVLVSMKEVRVGVRCARDSLNRPESVGWLGTPSCFRRSEQPALCRGLETEARSSLSASDQTRSTAILKPAAFKIARNVEKRGLPPEDSAR